MSKFKIIRAHHDAVADGGATLNNAADSYYASFQVRIRNDASIGNNRLPQSGAIDFASRQKARVCVNRRLGLKEAVLGHYIGEIQVRLVEGADCPDVFPVALKNKRADVPVFDR